MRARLRASTAAGGGAAGVNAAIYRFSPFSGTAPGLPWLAWSIVWVVGALALGIVLLRRREL